MSEESLDHLKAQHDHARFLAYLAACETYTVAVKALELAYESVRAGGGTAVLDRAIVAEMTAQRALLSTRTYLAQAFPSIRARRVGVEPRIEEEVETLLSQVGTLDARCEAQERVAWQKYRAFEAARNAEQAKQGQNHG